MEEKEDFSKEHVVPESWGGEDLCIKDAVCKKCNNDLLSKIESATILYDLYREKHQIPGKRGCVPCLFSDSQTK